MLALAYFWYWLSYKEDGEINGNNARKTGKVPDRFSSAPHPIEHRMDEEKALKGQLDKQNSSLHLQSAAVTESDKYVTDEGPHGISNSEASIPGVCGADKIQTCVLQERQNVSLHSKLESDDDHLGDHVEASHTDLRVPTLCTANQTKAALPLGDKVNFSLSRHSKFTKEEEDGADNEQRVQPQVSDMRFREMDNFTPATGRMINLGIDCHSTETSRECSTKLPLGDRSHSPVNKVATNFGGSAGVQSAQTATESESRISTVEDIGDSTQHTPQSPGSKESALSHGAEENVSGGPRFNPPVYIQRYTLVRNIMKKHSVQSMVDFGSAECKVIRWLKDIDTLTNLCLVDIDGALLNSNVFIVKPLNCEYIFRRPSPLTVSILEGSAGDLDCRVAGCQAASLIEIIEHLEPEVLKQVTHCVFGRLRPSLVVVTTPNADFNVLFPGFTGFRHWDHKFEWSREEFREWCEAVCSAHGYSISYTGVGDPFPHMSHVGFCSQAAIFTEISGKPGETTDEEVYRLVEEVVYPYDPRTQAEHLADEVDMAINSCRCREEHAPEDWATTIVIPITSIVDQVMTPQRNRNRWTSAQVWLHLCSTCTLSADGNSIVVEIESDRSSSSPESLDDEDDRADDGLAEPRYVVTEVEDWG